MAASSSNIRVVAPLSSVDTPLETFYQDFFDRAVDTILSEDVNIEESRDEMMDDNISTSDSPGPDAIGSKMTTSRLPRSQKPSTASRSAEQKFNLKSPPILENISEGSNPDEEDSISPGGAGHTAPELSDDLRPIETGELHGMAINDEEITPEDTIFASVSLGQRYRTLQFIVSHPFMLAPGLPALRAARRQFTKELREFVEEIGLDDTSINDLIDYVRITYLDTRGIAVPDNEGSAFGDEVDEEEPDTQILRRKRRPSDSDHHEKKKKNKKTKKSHSAKHRRHSHDSMSHNDSTQVVDAGALARVSTKVKRNDSVQTGESIVRHDETDHSKISMIPSLHSTGKLSVIVDPAESKACEPHAEPTVELLQDTRVNFSQIGGAVATADSNGLEKTNTQEFPSHKLPSEMVIADTPGDSIRGHLCIQTDITQSQRKKRTTRKKRSKAEKATPKETAVERNKQSEDPSHPQGSRRERYKRKRQKRRTRRNDENRKDESSKAQPRAQENSAPEVAKKQTSPSPQASHAKNTISQIIQNQILPSTSNHGPPSRGRRRSTLPPLAADPSEWNLDF